ncbi:MULTISPECIES: ParB N-terminal domain-containing protein [Acidithiobacillus]|uniref:ParB N-terminal domain-containing protein n=1 Tax=Acidithiobacillus TaxID=119977 RepID=UPI00094B20E0|nr:MULTISPECIES: ParB N-terminal domain-containing protein [Acidithiobacillus]MBE7563701.1 ParB N-terminal domain-containing protein [Acidithiobacillus sp. HP-6]MBE7569420.1 ParB N-terminal domain-containing protein [Acidithiobacillus sp. HP-2]
MSTQALAQTQINNREIRYARVERFTGIESVIQLMPPRDNGRPEFTTLLDSAREMGILNPVVAIEHNDGALYVIDGYMRIMVGDRLGLQQIPYIHTPLNPDDPAVVDMAARLNWSHRHLSDFEKVWVIGNHYISEKQREGAPSGNLNAAKTTVPNDTVVSSTSADGRTREKLADLYHVGARTVHRYGNMAKVCRSIIRVLAGQLQISEEDATSRFFDLWKDTQRGKHVDLSVLSKISYRLVEYGTIDDPDPWIRQAFSAYAVDLARFPKDSAAHEYALPNLRAEGLILATFAELEKTLPPKKGTEQWTRQNKAAPTQTKSGEYLPAEKNMGQPEAAIVEEIPSIPEDSSPINHIQQRAVQFQSGVSAMQHQLDNTLTAYIPNLTRLTDDLIQIMEDNWKEDFNSANKALRPTWEDISRFYRSLNLKKGILLEVMEADRDAITRLRSRLEKLAELVNSRMPEISSGLF